MVGDVASQHGQFDVIAEDGARAAMPSRNVATFSRAFLQPSRTMWPWACSSLRIIAVISSAEHPASPAAVRSSERRRTSTVASEIAAAEH